MRQRVAREGHRSRLAEPVIAQIKSAIYVAAIYESSLAPPRPRWSLTRDCRTGDKRGPDDAARAT